MTDSTILLKKEPKIEFQFQETGFQLIDAQKESNSGFYSYQDIQSVELNKVWFPRFSKIMRAVTWVLNGVPFFPDAESYKIANIQVQTTDSILGIRLTNSYMADMSRKLKKKLEECRTTAKS